MKNLLLPMNLQLFAEDDFVDQLSGVLGVSVETKEAAEPSTDEIVAEVDEPKVTEEVKEEVKEVKEPKKERDLEKDSAFAAQRREKEAIEKKFTDLEAQRANEQQERDDWYKNEYADHGITSEADYRNAIQKQKEDALKEKAVEGDSDAIEALLKSKVDEAVNGVKESAQIEAQKNARFIADVEKELFTVNDEFGTNFKNLNDLKTSPNGMIALSLMGTKKDDGSFLSAKEAYKMANVDTLLTSTKEKVRQEVLNKANGFNHTKVDPKPTGDTDNVTLDAATLAFYDKMGWACPLIWTMSAK